MATGQQRFAIQIPILLISSSLKASFTARVLKMLEKKPIAIMTCNSVVFAALFPQTLMDGIQKRHLVEVRGNWKAGNYLKVLSVIQKTLSPAPNQPGNLFSSRPCSFCLEVLNSIYSQVLKQPRLMQIPIPFSPYQQNFRTQNYQNPPGFY